MVPYYEIVEKYVGISGRPEGLPQLPDSVFLPPMEMTCAETSMRSRIKSKMDRTVTIGRVAILTKPHNGARRATSAAVRARLLDVFLLLESDNRSA